jgi:hypothetical protein
VSLRGDISNGQSSFKFNQSAFNFRYILLVSTDTEYGKSMYVGYLVLVEAQDEASTSLT